MGRSILAGRDRMSLENGFDLRLLSALEVLQARREADELAGSWPCAPTPACWPGRWSGPRGRAPCSRAAGRHWPG